LTEQGLTFHQTH